MSTNGTTKTLVSDAGQAFGLSQCTTYTTMGPDVTFSPSCVSAGTCNKCVCGPDGVVVWENAACFTYRFYVGSYVVMLLGFLWACAVIKNIVHCTISGTVAMWWFAGETCPSKLTTVLPAPWYASGAVNIVVALLYRP